MFSEKAFVGISNVESVQNTKVMALDSTSICVLENMLRGNKRKNGRFVKGYVK